MARGGSVYDTIEESPTMNDVAVKINFAGDRLVFKGPISGRDYVYLTKDEDGLIDIDERDVDELIKIKQKNDCGCSKHGTGHRVEYFLFERV